MNVKMFVCMTCLTTAFSLVASGTASAESDPDPFTFSPIPLPGEIANSYANKISNLNHVVVRFYDGTPALLWTDTETWNLPQVPGSMSCIDLGLNDDDSVVGGCFRAENNWDHHTPPLVPNFWKPGMRRPLNMQWLPGDHHSAASTIRTVLECHMHRYGPTRLAVG
jgi:hypothetical protein